MSVGENLKDLRLKRGKTLEDVAAYMHTSPQTIYKYENGIIKNIPIQKITQICKFLKTHPSTVMDWGEEVDADMILLNISEQLMLEEYRKLSSRSKEAVDSLIHSLTEIEAEAGTPKSGRIDLLKL